MPIKQRKNDPSFWEEFHRDLKHYVGRPSPVYHAARLSEHLGGAQIWLKREDLNHTGAHKVNNTIGQALLARRMGKNESSPKPARVSMAWPPLPSPPASV